MNSKQVLPLDIGNVLLKLDFSIFDTWFQSKTKVPRETFLPLFYQLVDVYESGKMTKDEFMNAFRQELSMSFDDAEFETKWCTCLRGPMDGMLELLQNKPPQIPAYVLSNTNDMHAPYFLGNNADLFAPFEKLFLSFEVGHVKPQPEIYETVIKAIGIPAKQILFFDDRPENIETAKACGLDAHLFKDAAQIKTLLDLN